MAKIGPSVKLKIKADFLKVAVTGALASGKSLACRLFAELGIPCVSADEIVHHLLVPETTIGRQVLQLFGEKILVGGKLSRKLIAQEAFSNDESLQSLEAILHPAVRETIEIQFNRFKEQGFHCAIAEIPLLFETGADVAFDLTIAIDTPESLCIERFCKAGGTKNEYMTRMNHQLSSEEKCKRASLTIQNQGSSDVFKKNVEFVYDQLMEYVKGAPKPHES